MDDHTKNLNYLLYRPYLLGIEKVIWSTKEMTFFKGRRLYCQPDLVFYNGDMWVGEYTCSPHHKFKKLDQLDRAKEMIERDFSLTPYLLYIVKKGNFSYDIERIRR